MLKYLTRDNNNIVLKYIGGRAESILVVIVVVSIYVAYAS